MGSQISRVIGQATANTNRTVQEDLLTTHLQYLCESIEPTEIITCLQSKKILTSFEAQQIHAEKTPYEKNYVMILMVQKKGGDAVRHLMESLGATNQEFIVARITNNIQGNESQNTNCNSELSRTQSVLKEMYLDRFQKVNPLSLPFTFDIETTWVSLALREDEKHSEETEDHAELLRKAFEKVKMLIIEGKPAMGKTSLMRRLAYEWAKGKEKLSHYDLVFYTEFREVSEKNYKTVAELVISYIMAYLDKQKHAEISRLITDEQYCREHRILILLDGYDESSLDEQCEELHVFLTASTKKKPLMFDVVLTARPGYLSKHRGKEGRFLFADVLGFTSDEQKIEYLSNHFSKTNEMDYVASITAVHNLLQSNEDLNNLAETPLFLTFICLVYDKVIDGTVLELYLNIVWWMLDRYQTDFPNRDVPKLFGFQRETGGEKFEYIHDNYLEFPQLLLLGEMALEKIEMSIFSKSDLTENKLEFIIEQVGLLRKEVTRANFRRKEEYFFPHRTIQEFLAALSFFLSQQKNHITDDNFIKLFKKDIDSDDSMMTEFDKFLWRIIYSRKLEIIPARRSDFLSRCVSICFDLNILTNITDVHFSNCSNVTDLKLYSSSGKLMINENEFIDLSKMVQLRKLMVVDGSLEICLSETSHSSALVQKRNNKSIFLLPHDIKVINFRRISFSHPELFCETMEYFLNFFRNGSPQIMFENVFVEKRNPNNGKVSHFVVNGTKEISSQNSPLKIIPEIFAEEIMNSALKYVSWADYLKIMECQIFVGQLSFEGFTKLETLKCQLMFFPVDALFLISKCSKLRKLEFFYCEIDLLAWQSITKEISNSAIRKLKLVGFLRSWSSITEDYYANYFGYLKKCQLIQRLNIACIDCKLMDDNIVRCSTEVKLANIICDVIKEMSGLQKIVIPELLDESTEEIYRTACETKGIQLVVR